MYSKLPALPGETPTKVTLETERPGDDAQRLFHETQAQIGAFQAKCRQARTISGQSWYSAHGALPGGGSVRYTYNSGQETLQVELTPPRARPTGGREPQPLYRAVPALAIDVVIEPELFIAEDLFYIARTSSPGSGGQPGQYQTWASAGYVPTVRQSIARAFPVTGIGYSVPKPGRPDEYDTYYDGRIDWTPGEDRVLYGNNPDVLAAIQGAVKGSTSLSRLETALSRLYIQTRDQQTNANVGTTDFGYNDFLAEIASSQTTKATATWAIVVLLYSTTATYPRGKPAGDYFESSRVAALVEFWARPDGYTDKQGENRLERFDTRDMVAIVAAPASRAPYRASSPGVIPPPQEDSRLEYLDPSAAEITVPRTLDAHEERGAPGTFGAGFLADAAFPPAGDALGIVTFDIYVASVNSTARNTPPGPVGSPPSTDKAEVIKGVDTELRLRIRAREFTTATVAVKVDTTQNVRNTRRVGDSTTITYTEGATSSGSSGNGELGPIAGPSGPPPPGIPAPGAGTTWAFAADKRWVDEGGEPSDPTAAGMGALLADSKPQVVTVTGPADAAAVIYRQAEWRYPIEAMTKVATLTWTPAKRPGDVGSAELEML